MSGSLLASPRMAQQTATTTFWMTRKVLAALSLDVRSIQAPTTAPKTMTAPLVAKP